MKESGETSWAHKSWVCKLGILELGMQELGMQELGETSQRHNTVGGLALARGNTTAASKGIKLHRWGGTHLLGGHITDYAHHLAGRSYRWPT